jgi:cardiolipin synthase
VEIYEYQRSILHAKVAVFDGSVACIGSSNIDPFSLMLAREANVFADDRGFAGELRASLEEAIRTGATPLARRSWRSQPILARLRIWLGYTIARALISLFVFERYH